MYSNQRIAVSPSLRPHSSLIDLNANPPVGRPIRRLLQSEHDLNGRVKHESTKRSKSFSMFYWFLGNRSMDQQFPYYSEISEWLRFQPLSILQLDPADRIVLFIAGGWLNSNRAIDFLFLIFFYVVLVRALVPQLYTPCFSEK